MKRNAPDGAHPARVRGPVWALVEVIGIGRPCRPGALTGAPIEHEKDSILPQIERSVELRAVRPIG
jgi:hypothetical protein